MFFESLWVHYGALGILAVVIIVVFPKLFGRVLKVVENNTAAFTKLNDSIKNINGNQNELKNNLERHMTDQSKVTNLQCRALKSITKELQELRKNVKRLPKKKKRK